MVLQTFFAPFQGHLVDRFGPRPLITTGAVLTGLSWVLAAQADRWPSSIDLRHHRGLGTGIVYIGVVGQMVRAGLPDRPRLRCRRGRRWLWHGRHRHHVSDRQYPRRAPVIAPHWS